MGEPYEPPGRAEYPPPNHFAWIIGQLIMHFSYAETAMQFLTWRILGLSFLDGRALTGRLDARPKIALLNELCSRHIKSDTQSKKLLEATNALEIAAGWRNMAAHGDWRADELGRLYCFSVQYDSGDDPGETGKYGVKPAKASDVAKAAQDCQLATEDLWDIDAWLKVTPRGSW